MMIVMIREVQGLEADAPELLDFGSSVVSRCAVRQERWCDRERTQFSATDLRRGED